MKRVILALILSTLSAYGYTPNNAQKKITSDGSIADTQAAINYIHDRGEDAWVLTVGAPGGNYTWATALTIDVGGHTFTMQGADPSNRPSISTTSTGDCGIQVFAGSNLVTFKDLKFVGFANVANAFIRWYGTGEVMHITNCYVNPSANKFWLWTSGLGVNGGGAGPFGLIDHCEITIGMFIRQNQDSPDAEFPNNFWDGNHTTSGMWGTRNAVFLEDNMLTGSVFAAGNSISSMTDGGSAAKIVVRKNTITNAGVSVHGRDSTGYGSLFREGPLSMEVYQNNFQLNVPMSTSLVVIRGGTALVHHNSVTLSGIGQVGAAVSFQLHCAGSAFAGEGCLDQTTGAALTAPLSYPANYPDLQQPGFPEPVRIWRNSGAPDAWFGANPGGAFIQQNREFYYSSDDSAARSGYTPFTYPHPLNTGNVPTIPSGNVPPLASGVAAQGQTLTVSAGSWSGYPAPSYSYQWVRCDESLSNCSNINGATSLSYVQGSADVGKRLAVDETATNSQGSSTRRSNYTDLVAAPGSLNRLTNGGFETHSGAVEPNLANNAAWPGWTVTDYGAGWLQTSTSAHNGTAAFTINKTGGSTVMAVEQDFVPANPGETMQVSFWQKSRLVGYGLTYYVKDLTHNTDIIARQSAGDATGYTKVETSFVVPAGCTLAKIGFDSSGMGAGGGSQIWLDDVVVAPAAVSGPAPPSNLHVTVQ